MRVTTFVGVLILAAWFAHENPFSVGLVGALHLLALAACICTPWAFPLRGNGRFYPFIGFALGVPVSWFAFYAHPWLRLPTPYAEYLFVAMLFVLPALAPVAGFAIGVWIKSRSQSDRAALPFRANLSDSDKELSGLKVESLPREPRPLRAFLLAPLAVAVFALPFAGAREHVLGVFFLYAYLATVMLMYVMLLAILVVVALPLRLARMYRFWPFFLCTALFACTLVVVAAISKYLTQQTMDYVRASAFVATTALLVAAYWFLRKPAQSNPTERREPLQSKASS